MKSADFQQYNGEKYVSFERAARRADELNTQFAQNLMEASLVFGLTTTRNVPPDDVQDLGEEILKQREEDKFAAEIPGLPEFVASARQAKADVDEMYRNEIDRLAGRVPKKVPGTIAEVHEIVLTPRGTKIKSPSGRTFLK